LHIQQPKGRRRFVYIPQQLPKKILVLFPAYTQTNLRYQIAEGTRRRQLVCSP
jgi:hypothetical protein